MHRRTLLSGLAAAALAVTAAGCSSSSTPASSGTAPAEGSATSAAGGAFPATISTAFGDVTVQAKPQRVVALGWGDAETALALGTQPVGASDWLGFGGSGVGPWMKDAYTNPPQLIETMEPSFEKIAALKPDLILDVKSSGDKQRYQRLSSIAPTVGIPTGAENYLTSATDQTTMIATALGEKAKGEALVTEVKDKFAAAAAAHPAWKGKTFTAATKTSDGWGAYIKGSDRVTFLESLGLVQNPKIAAMKPNATGFAVSLSAENLSDIDADVVVGFPIFIPTEQMTGDASFKAVPAVKDGHAVVIDGDLAKAYSLGTTTATSYAIDQLVPKLETALGT